MGAPLEGLRVLDMTQYEAGPSCTQMLAWLGAEVVKIESPRGDPGRRTFARTKNDSQYFLNYNANKRSVVLDLKHPRGRELLLDLVPRFDAFVENFGPGVIESLDIGYDVFSERNPGLIYVRLKGYGLDGPYSHYKSFDPLAQAAAGAFSITGDAEGPPVKPGPTYADTGTGMQGALAVAAAWAQKLQTGDGAFIEISMQEVMTMFMRTTGVLQWAREPVKRKGHRGGAPTGMYPCAPGGTNDYVHLLVSNTRMWDQLCIAMERDDLLIDERFRSGRSRQANADLLDDEISKWTKKHTKFEAMKILCEGGVAASAVFDTMEVFNDPHLASRDFIKQLDHPTEGQITLMGSPIRMSGVDVSMTPAPLLGADTRAVLGEELGLQGQEVEQLFSTGVIAPTTRKPGGKQE